MLAGQGSANSMATVRGMITTLLVMPKEVDFITLHHITCAQITLSTVQRTLSVENLEQELCAVSFLASCRGSFLTSMVRPELACVRALLGGKRS